MPNSKEQCEALLPHRRFGRTELSMPVLTCGGMRQQQSWGRSTAETFSMTDVAPDCQANFEAIIARSMELGINHFETARGYGSSELQFGAALKRMIPDRSSYILQTKVAPNSDPAKFRKDLESSLELLVPEEGDFVDLLSFHGVNRAKIVDWITGEGAAQTGEGGLMAIVEEFRAKGKIKHVGFSTHGMTPVILKAVNTGKFDYINMHYHFIGSYTSSGTGSAANANQAVLRAATAQDMGVFIISPTDKGGHLYHPTTKFAKASEPLSPIEFHNLWLLSHDDDEMRVCTMVVGAARPGDLDEHVKGVSKIAQTAEHVPKIVAALDALRVEALGQEFVDTWWKGLPDAYGNIDGEGPPDDVSLNPKGTNFTNLVWLWSLCKAFDMVDYARGRYSFLENNTPAYFKQLKEGRSHDEIVDGWSWTAGCIMSEGMEGGYSAEDLTTILARSPLGAKTVARCLAELHEMCKKDSEFEMPPFAFDLRPDVPYPDRGEGDFKSRVQVLNARFAELFNAPPAAEAEPAAQEAGHPRFAKEGGKKQKTQEGAPTLGSTYATGAVLQPTTRAAFKGAFQTKVEGREAIGAYWEAVKAGGAVKGLLFALVSVEKVKSEGEGNPLRLREVSEYSFEGSDAKGMRTTVWEADGDVKEANRKWTDFKRVEETFN